MFTLKTRIAVINTVVLGAVLCAFAYLVYINASKDEQIKLWTRIESHSVQWKMDLEEELNRADGEEPDEEVHPLDTEDLLALGIDSPPGLISRLVNRRDVAFRDNDILASVSKDIVGLTLEGRTIRHTFRNDSQDYQMVQVPIDVENADGEDEVGYVLQIAAPTMEMGARLRQLRLLFIIAIPTALLVAMLTSSVVVRLAFRPLTRMADVAERVSAQDLAERVPVPNSRDEVRRLALSLNEMMSRIEAAFAGQRQFVANASHELRTPLTTIRTELEYALRQLRESPSQGSISIAQNEVDRLAHMCDRLMLVTQLDSAQRKLQLEPVRLDEILADCVRLVKSSADEKSVRIVINVTEELTCRADPELLRVALRNLLDNAVKYSPKNATVETVTSRTDDERPGIQVSIRDEGPGITEHDLGRIFDRFYRSDRARADESGSGLGLAIVKRISELHGWTIMAKNRPGKGSEFVLTIPS